MKAWKRPRLWVPVAEQASAAGFTGAAWGGADWCERTYLRGELYLADDDGAFVLGRYWPDDSEGEIRYEECGLELPYETRDCGGTWEALAEHGALQKLLGSL